MVYERTHYATSDCSGSPSRTSLDGLVERRRRQLAAAAPGRPRPRAGGRRPDRRPDDRRLLGRPRHIVATTSCPPAGCRTCSAPVPVDGTSPTRGCRAVDAHPQPDIAVGVDGAGRPGGRRLELADRARLPGPHRDVPRRRRPYSPPAVAVTGTDDQFGARLAAAQGSAFGRVDLAFLQNAGSNTVLARTTSSDTPPTADAGETWSTPVRVQANATRLATTRRARRRAGSGSRRRRPPRALVWTDSQTGRSDDVSDIDGNSLLHGSIAPSLASASRDVAVGRPVQHRPERRRPRRRPAALQHRDGACERVGEPAEPGTAAAPVHPAAWYDGPDSIVVQVTDGVSTSTATLSLLVGNSPPDISCGTVTTNENQPVPIDLSSCVTDINGDLAGINVLTTAHGTLSANVFTPDANFSGRATISFQAVDSHGASTNSTLTVNVLPVDNVAITIAPLAGQRIVAVGQPVAFQVTASDGKSRNVSWTFSDRPKAYAGSLVTRVWTTVRHHHRHRDDRRPRRSSGSRCRWCSRRCSSCWSR